MPKGLIVLSSKLSGKTVISFRAMQTISNLVREIICIIITFAYSIQEVEGIEGNRINTSNPRAKFESTKQSNSIS